MSDKETSGSADYAAVTPSDTVGFGRLTRAIYVGVAGNVVAVCPVTGTAITFTGVAAGQIYPIQTARINSTSTTATNLVALF